MSMLESRVKKISHVSDIRDDHKVASAGDVTATLTAQHVLSGILYSNPATAITLTLPDASDLVTSDGKSDTGAGLHLYIRNDGGFAVTVAVPASGTLQGSDQIATGAYTHWYLSYTNVTPGSEAYTLIRLA